MFELRKLASFKFDACYRSQKIAVGNKGLKSETFEKIQPGEYLATN